MTDTRRKSTLFLVEQLIVIAVFALCAIACINILTASYFMVKDSSETARALIEAQNFAEGQKAFYSGGLVSFLPGENAYGTTEIFSFYDDAWRQIPDENNAVYILKYEADYRTGFDSGRILNGTVTVSRAGGGVLVSLPLAALRATSG